MKKLSYAILIMLILLIAISLGTAASIYDPTGIPFDYDPDGDAFSVRVLNWQAGMNTTNGDSWKLKWTPAAEQEGLHYINIEAWDFPPDPNDSLTDRGTIVFNVRPRNRPPILLPWSK